MNEGCRNFTESEIAEFIQWAKDNKKSLPPVELNESEIESLLKKIKIAVLN